MATILNRVLSLALVAVCLFGIAALPAVADSITFAQGDMAVLTQSTEGNAVYYLNAAGTEQKKLATLSASYNTWDLAFNAQGKILVGTANGLYRIDPSNYDSATSGTAMTVNGLSDFTGVATGAQGGIYVRGLSSGAQKYFRLTAADATTFNTSVVGPSSGLDHTWQIAVESDVAGAAQLLGFSKHNLYRFSEASGTATKLNASAIVSGEYSIAYDAAKGVVYVGSYSSNYISKVNVSDGTTTQNWATVNNLSRGLEFYNGYLYATAENSTSTLYKIDAAGTATAFGTATFNGARGIAIYTVPEPGTTTLLLMGIGGLVCYAWRKQK